MSFIVFQYVRQGQSTKHLFHWSIRRLFLCCRRLSIFWPSSLSVSNNFRTISSVFQTAGTFFELWWNNANFTSFIISSYLYILDKNKEKRPLTHYLSLPLHLSPFKSQQWKPTDSPQSASSNSMSKVNSKCPFRRCTSMVPIGPTI